MPNIDYEKSSLRFAIRLLQHNMPRRAKVDGEIFRCPRCGHYVDNYFCAECGQRIYWKWSIRPFDEKRRQTEYRHNDIGYIDLQERREIEWYVRINGLDWVLERLRKATKSDSPIDVEQVRRWAEETEYKPGDHLTAHDAEYERAMEARKREAEKVPKKRGRPKKLRTD